ncbi:hypothetical protein GCM10008932_02400 [Alkalibacterium iburiense]|uniref:N-acetyltransferase domain-containing protein n=1 Tax=Alkalibacterium iburiense TaxID=290589 RepID=A0ABN0X1X6_9LACT
MTLTTRPLTKEDFHLYERMQTQLEEDYMLRVFNRLTEGDNFLFGLFAQDTLIAVAGYTLFADEFAILGRLRSDVRYRKKGYGSKIIEYVIEEALKNPSVQWIGANTEQHNKPALSILKKFNMSPVATLYAAQTDDVSSLCHNQSVWHEVTSMDEKVKWVQKTYLNPDFETNVFPIEAYYPFPARPSLFENQLNKWRFFENDNQTRYMMIGTEEKGKSYLHVVYPWSDFMKQSGFFKTVHSELERAKVQESADLIWMDLTEEEVASLPSKHPFELPSPWVLHGKSKEAFRTSSIVEAFSEASHMLENLENEIDELEAEMKEKEQALEESRQKFQDISDTLEEH